MENHLSFTMCSSGYGLNQPIPWLQFLSVFHLLQCLHEIIIAGMTYLCIFVSNLLSATNRSTFLRTTILISLTISLTRYWLFFFLWKDQDLLLCSKLLQAQCQSIAAWETYLVKTRQKSECRWKNKSAFPTDCHCYKPTIFKPVSTHFLRGQC